MASEQQQKPVEGKALKIEEYPEMVKNGLDKVAKELGFVKYELKLKPGSNLGDGYMGVIMRVSIEGKKPGKAKAETMNVLAKIPPASKERRIQFRTHLVFEREIAMYTKYFPTLVKYQKGKGVKEADGFYNYPKCYHTEIDMETGDAVIIMEDLRDKEYIMLDKFQMIDLPHARSVLETLGKLHALSLALKIQEPELFKEYMYKDTLFDRLHETQSKQMFEDMFTQAVAGFQPEDKAVVEKLLKFRDNVTEEIMNLLNPELAEPYAVLNHGDCWTNNFLFRHHGNIPADIKLIDFQISRYASPVLDLMYFIFTSSDKAFRKEHYEECLKIYHNSLSKLLKRLGEDPEVVFSFDDLQKQLKEFGKFGIPMALMMIPVTAQRENIPDMDKMADMVKELRNKPMEEWPEEVKKGYEEFIKLGQSVAGRTRDVAIDICRLGYL